MSKLVSLAIALCLAAAGFSSNAEAGMRGIGVGIGVGILAAGAMHAMANSQRYEAREYRAYKKTRAVRRERDEKASIRTAKTTKPRTSDEALSPAAGEASSIAAAQEASIVTGSTETGAEMENSSITLVSTGAAAQTTDAPTGATAPERAASLGCKKFFPSVGMTLSVPCE